MSGERGPQQPSRGPLVVVAIVAGLCSGIASALALRLVENEPAKAEPVASRPAGVAEDLAAIRQDLAAVRQQIEQLRLPTGGSNAAADAAPAPLAPAVDYGPMLARLSAQVDRIAVATRAVPLPEEAFRIDPSKRDRLLPLNPDGGVPTAKWRLWTLDQLIDAYGFPNIVTAVNGTLGWSYRWDDGTTVTFVVLDGLAVELSVTQPAKR